jgi:hypothetical protein
MGPRLRRDDVGKGWGGACAPASAESAPKKSTNPIPAPYFCDIISGFVLQRAKTNVKAGI